MTKEKFLEECTSQGKVTMTPNNLYSWFEHNMKPIKTKTMSKLKAKSDLYYYLLESQTENMSESDIDLMFVLSQDNEIKKLLKDGIKLKPEQIIEVEKNCRTCDNSAISPSRPPCKTCMRLPSGVLDNWKRKIKS